MATIETTTQESRQLAAKYLSHRGYELLDEDPNLGCIDFVARDHENNDLVFVAVNTRLGSGGDPADGVDRPHAEYDAAIWLGSAENAPLECTARFDVVSLKFFPGGNACVRHLKHVLTEG